MATEITHDRERPARPSERGAWRADYTPAPPPSQPLTTDDLAALKRTWFAEAMSGGDVALLGRLARELGQPVPTRHPPKWHWTREGVSVYDDGFGRFLTVHQGDRLVCSTHSGERLFVPGPWLDVVRGARPELEREAAARATEREAAQRLALRRELGLDD
jgi:hypothetical protein